METFHEWVAFINERPRGEERQDWRIAQLYEALSVGIKKRGGGRVGIGDFFKRLNDTKPKPQTAAEQFLLMKEAFPSHKAKYAERDKRRKKCQQSPH